MHVFRGWFYFDFYSTNLLRDTFLDRRYTFVKLVIRPLKSGQASVMPVPKHVTRIMTLLNFIPNEISVVIVAMTDLTEFLFVNFIKRRIPKIIKMSTITISRAYFAIAIVPTRILNIRGTKKWFNVLSARIGSIWRYYQI